MATTAVDWSWSQPYHAPVFEHSPSFPPGQHAASQWPSSGSAGAGINDLFSAGFKVTPFRTAVPSPATRSLMPSLAPMSHHRASSFAGRKRSCAEISSEDDSSNPRSALSSGDASSSPTKIIKPDTGSDAMDAASQSRVWADELAERLRSSSFPDGSVRPKMESRKSIRLDPSASGHDLAAHNATSASPMTMDSAEPPLPAPPTHDEATLTLGVGWTVISAAPVMMAAARGWARFIESAFPLRNVRLVWQNTGLSAFLVSAVTVEYSPTGRPTGGSPGYYLFDESLTQGKFVARSWERCLDLLRAQPMQFDSADVMEAHADQYLSQAESSRDAIAMAEMPMIEDRPLGMEID